jgi:large conductance mechanosensitive channel
MAVVFGYGAFLTALINFLLIALVVFGIVQGGNRLHRKKTNEAVPSPPAETKSEKLLFEIQDILKQRPR